ncbi:hypothetical protein [Acanthamoeba castellanii mimivirus]|nr:hypothetical protein MIMI_gp0203 [Acanthamoeba polyphaga mimivirus]ALR83694.1 hypothetical protein [Niemeyer virus]BAV61271.1 hypothetical protein [Acanthamoeba castellanii mimivirus]AAV50457.1 unknown [Acanthamoeba polyphaga mimivirus]ADO18039.1 hypothetical protein [Acanthamoeba polyphaga mimivirus]AKI80840.1 hypothetical protein [Acanthamoeba polyphaga mimivirus]
MNYLLYINDLLYSIIYSTSQIKMCDFVFCYGSSNERKLSMNIKETKKGLQLYVSNSEYIYIEIKKTYRKNLVINFEDSLKFMKFLVRKKIHCQFLTDKHGCGFCKNYREYFQYIVQNKHMKHIKFFVGKFIPMIRSRCGYSEFNLSNVVEDNKIFENNNIDLEIVKYMFEIGNLFDVDYIVVHVLTELDDIEIDFIDSLIDIYKQKITYLFTEDFSDIDNLLYTVLDLNIFITPALKTDDINLFNYVVEELSSIMSDIKEEELSKKQIIPFKKIKSKYILDADRIFKLIDICVGSFYEKSFHCPNIFKQLVEDYIENHGSIRLLFNNFFRKIVANDKFAYAGILCEKVNSDQNFLRKILFESVGSIKEAQILIDYGLDHEEIYEDPDFRKLPKTITKFIKKLIKETSN